MPPSGPYPKASSIHYTSFQSICWISISIFPSIKIYMYPTLSPPLYTLLRLHEGNKAHRLQVHHTIFCDVNECVKNKRIPQTFKRYYAVCMHMCVCVCVCVCVWVCILMCIQCMHTQILYQDCEETQCRFRSQEQDSREDSCGHGIVHSIP